ncbi:MAG: lipid-binding protein [Ginsengibacter sp.]
MKKLMVILLIVAAIPVMHSCEKVKDAGATSAVKIANEWWVTLDSVGIVDYYGIGHIKISTYNTAANNNDIWIDDFQSGYGFKAIATADYTNLTFSSGATSHNEYFEPGGIFAETVHITDGKIFSKTGHSKSGNVADSIHMKMEFSDSPGFIYEMNGVERTRFPEDDY